MDLLESCGVEAVGIAVAVVGVAAGAAYFYLGRKSKGSLDPENFRDFKLVQKKQISHNVAKFRFSLPAPTSVLGLPIGQHLSCRGKDNLGEEVIKPYTPTTLDSDLGYFELVIKMYPQGRMSHHFREMKVGDYLSVKGPKFGRGGYRCNSDGRILSSSASTPVSSDSLAEHVSSTPSPTTGSPSPVAGSFGLPTARSLSPVAGSSILQLQDLRFSSCRISLSSCRINC